MIPFRTFALPKIYASIARGFILNEANDVSDELEDLFGGGLPLNAKETPHSLDHLNHPHTEIGQGEFIGDTEHIRKKGGELSPHYKFDIPTHRTIIQQYTGTHWEDGVGHDAKAFRYINARILKLGVNEPLPGDEHNMKIMDDALRHHTTPHDLTVYSGLGQFHGDVVATNQRVHHPAYLSTSLRPDMAMGFAHCHLHGTDVVAHLLKIHVPQGHPGAYVDHISRNPGEQEFILPRDTTLHIDHGKRQYMKIPFSFGRGGNRHYFIHHAYPTK